MKGSNPALIVDGEIGKVDFILCAWSRLAVWGGFPAETVQTMSHREVLVSWDQDGPRDREC